MKASRESLPQEFAPVAVTAHHLHTLFKEGAWLPKRS